MTAAVRVSDLPSPARLVMFVLADIADNDTAVIHAARTLSLSELARQTGLSRRAVMGHLNTLEASGWVKRDQPEDSARARAGEKTKYQLKIGGRAGDALGQEMPYLGRAGDALEVGQEVPWGRAGDALKRKNPSTTPQEPSKSFGASAPERRGARIPADFSATPEMVDWARKNTPLVGAAETENFRDYWIAESGARSKKLDWVAAWRKWMRKAQADATARGSRRSTGANRFTNSDRPDANPFAGGANATVASRHAGGLL